MDDTQILVAILIMSAANFATRLFPFLFFVKREPSAWVIYVEKTFPPTIMTILVFYSLKDIDFALAPYGTSECLAVLATAALHLSLRNYLVSIFAGTLFYMFLVQVAFQAG